MFNRPYSRKLEAEADKIGLQLAAKVPIYVYTVYYVMCMTPLMDHVIFTQGIRGHCCQTKPAVI